MWHDPMDELIGELEDRLPAREARPASDTLSMEDFCTR